MMSLLATFPFASRRALRTLGPGLLLLPLAATGAGEVPTTGMASFQARGNLKTHASGVAVWSGTFVGASVTDSRHGPLHNAGWDCTGETVIKGSQALRSGGFCVVTDADGDAIDVIWERTDVPASLAEPRTRGTYVSGTGKFSGIEGYYTLSCRQSGLTCTITAGEYRIR